MTRIFLITVLFCFSSIVFSQENEEKDSLLTRIKSIENDTLRVKEALEITRSHYLNNTELALFLLILLWMNP